MSLCSTALVLFLYVASVCSYPSGLYIDDACLPLSPSHGAAAQAGASPYRIALSTTTYTPGMPVTITISSTSTGFKGFMIQARRDDNTYSDGGNFQSVAGTQYACSQRALVHNNATVKTSLTFTWTPPSTSVDSITFKAAFVQSKTVFWNNVASVPMISAMTTTKAPTAQSTSLPTTLPTTTRSGVAVNTTAGPLGPIPMDDECGKTKGCFSLCAHGGCRFIVKWTEVDKMADYTLKSSVSHANGTYMALGLSSDHNMGGDSIIGCYHGATGTNYRFAAESTGRVMPKTFVDSDLKILSSSYSAGIFTCLLRRPVSGMLRLFDVNKQWTLFFATGPASDSSGKVLLEYHAKSRYISESTASISTQTNIQPLTSDEINKGMSSKIFWLNQFSLVSLILLNKLFFFGC